MDTSANQQDEFLSLRQEIRASRTRLFWILVIGLIGVPALTYLATLAEFYIWLLVPYSVLLLIVMFLSEQSSMMRAGRYIRERIETESGTGPQWEGWLESRPHFRTVDRHYVACFLIVFFLYYFMTVGVAINLILRKEATDMSGSSTYWYWFYGALVTYAIGAIWALATLVTHWRATVSTASNSNG
ncbi:MAG: hypothetical protein GY842_24430 [bacterium]|nr:hypothetical protein [bacterium]